MGTVYLSAVTPVYRGAKYLRALANALDQTRCEFARSDMPVELIEAIFVDDSSVDESPGILAELGRQYSWIRTVELSRNFGQHAATAAGILHSSGDWVVTLDEDMQHDPRHVTQLLLHAIRSRADVVYGIPQGSVHESMFRNVTSRVYKHALSVLAGNPVIRRFSSFRMMRGSVVRAACSVATHDAYFDVILGWFTNRFDVLPLPLLDVRSVQGGQSGYSVRKLLGHARRMLISSEIKPLRLASATGLLVLLASIVLAAVTLILKLLFPQQIELRGWASLMITISFFGGLTSLLLGVALEYISTIVLHTLGKPTFFVVDRSKDEVVLPFANRG